MNIAIKYFILLTTLSLVLGSCKKDVDDWELIANKQKDANQQSPLLLAEHFKDLRVETFDPIAFEGNKSTSLQEAFNKRKTADLAYLRDSTWAWGQGYSKFYESDEMVVTPSNLSYIYPGSILKASSIATDNFATLFGYERAPISVRLSFPSSLSVGTITTPSLSESRVFLRNAIMAPDFSGQNIDDFSQSISFFSKYEEVKLAYGYNVNEKRLFSSTNSSFDNSTTNTEYATKLMASYTVKNFTYSMSDPIEGELIDISSIPPDVFNGVSPVYINSVTYGRFGLLVVETNNNSIQMKNVFEKVVNKIFKKTTESFTQEELSLFGSTRVTIYLLGSTLGESTTQLLINPNVESVTSFISENIGTFTAQDPGVPISFTAKYLKDNSQFKTVFKLDFPN